MRSIKESLKLYGTLSRFEFLPAVTVAILIGIFLGADTFGSLLSLSVAVMVIEGLIIFYLLFNVGFMINCWADWKVDEIYKKNLASAVREFGRQRLLNLVIIHIVIALILAFHISFIHTHRPGIFMLVLLGVFIGVGYSVEPYRFKSRGSWHALMAIPVFAIPGTFAYLLVKEFSFFDTYDRVFMLLVLGITCAHYALVLISQSEDYPDDKSAGLKTPPVAWGLKKALRVSLNLNIFGSICTLIAFSMFFAITNISLLILMPLLAVALFQPTMAVYSINLYSRSTGSTNKILERIRSQMKNYPKWHGIPLGAIMLFSLILLISRTIM